jgi:uncharacterized protein YciI
VHSPPQGCEAMPGAKYGSWHRCGAIVLCELVSEEEMQFLVIGYDGSDAQALNRRLAVREAHLALGDKMRDAGKMLYGAAILDDLEHMVGSVLICDFESRDELDQWLKNEPYVTGNVWQKIEVKACRVGPSFANLVTKK